MRTWNVGRLLLSCALAASTLVACNNGPGKDDTQKPTESESPCEEGLWYEDADEDGHGTLSGEPIKSCDAPGPGYALNADDCDDGDAGVNPDEDEVCDPDDIDENCNGSADELDGAGSAWYPDEDGDGYGTDEPSTFTCDAPTGYTDAYGDCDDTDAATFPGAEESCTDAVDRNCDGATDYVDADGDGAAACEDCDDNNAEASPFNRESCDGVDNDCDGAIDDGAFDARNWYTDADLDGYGDDLTEVFACEGPIGSVNQSNDCDDTDPNIHPNADEDCSSGIDANCDGSVGDADLDGDGKIACEDCNDGDAGVFEPGVEVCDGIDNDCDLDTDEDDAEGAPNWYYDADGDGAGAGDLVFAGCNPPEGYVGLGDDCDDGDATVGSAVRYYTDLDGDGYGDVVSEVVSCDVVPGAITTGEDCDDADDTINPEAIEVCDGLDNDCDGRTDLDVVDGTTYFADTDGDGYGDAGNTVTACDLPAGYVGNDEDCDDRNLAVNPGALEMCNALDDNCDGNTDGADAIDPNTWYADLDGDGWGDADAPQTACEAPADTVADPGDCDDTDNTVSPGETERCDSGLIDEDCNGLYDDEDPSLAEGTYLYLDLDGDLYGDAGDVGRYWCELPSGSVDNDLDCDDTNNKVNPISIELCNSFDDDCNGVIDEDSAADAPVWHADLDLDGYGDANSFSTACTQPTGLLADGSDCDDTTTLVSPVADEYCNFIDDNCDGVTDNSNAVDSSTWYADTDGDGWGDVTNQVDACYQPVGYLVNDTDCDDSDPDISPGEMERCEIGVVDEDCDGRWDDEDDNIDPATQTDFYLDLDADSFGDPGAVLAACAVPPGYETNADDCDDADDSINPDATEICDPANVDENCTGLADDDDPGVNIGTFLTWYDDFDGDNFGDPDATSLACDAPSGTLDDNQDCDDADSLINPDATEICLDGIDNDCDGRSLGCGLARNQVGSSFYSRFYGVDNNDAAGVAVDPAGDFNGDGRIDIIIGATGADDGGSNSGAAYIVYGLTAGDTELTSPGVTLIGEAASDGAGISVGAVGDVDGDGYDDVLVGATGVDDGAVTAGAAYLVLGNRSGRIDLSAANVQYRGATAADGAGSAVDGRLDFSGDDVIDLAIGASRAEGGGTNRGEVYVVSSDVRASSGNEVDLDVEADLIARGVTNSDGAGTTVSFVPDVNGDGLAELLIGVPTAQTGATEAGAAYMVYGGTTGTVSLSNADVEIEGNVNADEFGAAVSAGDVDDDGNGDLVIGVSRDDTASSDAGAVAVFLSPRAYMVASEADTLITGVATLDRFGSAVDATADLDGDGIPDLVIGAPQNDSGASGGGAVYIVLTPPSRGNLAASLAEGRILGDVASGAAGSSVASLGDGNGDGYADLLFGAPSDITGGTGAGAVYVFVGSGP